MTSKPDNNNMGVEIHPFLMPYTDTNFDFCLSSNIHNL